MFYSFDKLFKSSQWANFFKSCELQRCFFNYYKESYQGANFLKLYKL